VQLHTPVRVSSGIFPGRQLQSTSSGSTSGDEIPIAYRGDDLSAYNQTVHNSRHSGLETEPARLESRDGDVPPLPPTYDEAIMASRDEGLKKEKDVAFQNW
jgi:hypothetical protein